jgi:hypothetical protein
MVDSQDTYHPPSRRASWYTSLPMLPEPTPLTFFGFQNALRSVIQSGFHQVKGFYNRTKKTKLLSLCNLYAGCRGVEWAQTSSSQRYLSTFLRNRFQHAYAFTLADVLWLTESSSPVSIPAAITKPLVVGKIKAPI